MILEACPLILGFNPQEEMSELRSRAEALENEQLEVSKELTKSKIQTNQLEEVSKWTRVAFLDGLKWKVAFSAAERRASEVGQAGEGFA